jgi:hypothetical protein
MKNQPKELFLQTLNLTALALSIIGFTILYWQIIYLAIPDPLTVYYGSTDAIRTMMALLIVAWPTYLFAHTLIRKDLHATIDAKESRIRRWYSYITLFFAVLTLLIDLIVILSAFLGGELTAHFALRLLVVLASAGAVSLYTIWDMKNVLASKIPVIAGILASLAVLSSLIFGFMEIGTPMEQRKGRLDEERVNELTSIKYNMLNFYTTKKALPESLTEVSYNEGDILDPATDLAYRYRVVNSTTFELCADFATKSENADRALPDSKPYGFTAEETFAHTEGENCFTLTVDPADLTPKL